ncbi:hypothetical protein JZM24_16950 [Candidatus Sodalis endolongispinus]|uniref:Secreted protein n=1 Tax=Candidatus Sodalis endolongispinus TaxID=2812662 RepID=A0ABS5YEK2_9GAMM|nr:hypothetical protein [Candidatus Sodalis endolongispinus]MBT9433369.1 hypothetical protein [Candidatus Sodalis endolongispinus]
MKLSFSAFIVLGAFAISQAAVASRLTDMPRDQRNDSACMAQTTADTAGRCPAQRFSADNNQAIKDYSPEYHQQHAA